MINDNKVILIRNFILSEIKKMSSRVRIVDAEIEVESKKKNSSSNFRFKVLRSNTKSTLMRIVYSAYEADGKYLVRSSEEELPTEEVNELFYAIARH
nr:MAG TPA: hypothetical protein [Caudoviricetes sp.]